MSDNWNIYKPRTLGNKTKCWYCGKEGVTNKDHFFPKQFGGGLIVRSCFECNESKGGLTPRQWLWKLKREGVPLIRYNRIETATISLWDKVKHSL